jgi:hypothetical protein
MQQLLCTCDPMNYGCTHQGNSLPLDGGHFCERVRDSWTGLFKTSLRLHNAQCVVCVGTAHCLNAFTHGSIQTSASDWSSATSRCSGSWWWWWGTTCRCGRSHSAPAQAQTPHASRYVEQDTVYPSVIQIQICQMPFLRACRVDWKMQTPCPASRALAYLRRIHIFVSRTELRGCHRKDFAARISLYARLSRGRFALVSILQGKRP